MLSATDEDITMMKYMIDTSSSEFAANMTEKGFPLLRELAKLVVAGYKFPKPGVLCI